MYRILNEVQQELLNKADKEHTHTSFDTLNVTTLNTNSINGNTDNSLTRIQSSRNSNRTARLELAVDTTGGRIGDITVSQYNAYFKSCTRSATLLDANGNTSFPCTLTASNVKADNESRLASVETELNDKAPIEHTHTEFDKLEVSNLKAVNTGSINWYSSTTDSWCTLTPNSMSMSNMDATQAVTIKKSGIDVIGQHFDNGGNNITDITITDAGSVEYTIRLNSTITDDGNARISLDEFFAGSKITFKCDADDFSFIIQSNNYQVGVNDTFSITTTGNFNQYFTYDTNKSIIYLDYFDKSSIGSKTFRFNITKTNTDGVPIIRSYVYDVRITCSLKPNTDAIVNNMVPNTKFIVDWLYPVGSIYMSMSNTNPKYLFGGNWQQIVDRFLLCSAADATSSGGSATITTDNLPAHDHTFTATTSEDGFHNHVYAVAEDRNGYPDGSADSSYGNTIKESYWRGNKYIGPNATTSGGGFHSHTVSGTTSSIGNGQEYWQPFMRCYCWYRTA